MKKLLLGLGTVTAVVTPVVAVVACSPSEPSATMTVAFKSSKTRAEIDAVFKSFKSGSIKDLLNASGLTLDPADTHKPDAIYNENDKVTKVFEEGSVMKHWVIWTDKYAVNVI